MDKIKIGIPRALHYYYYGTIWKSFLEELGYDVIISPETTKEILENGSRCANDEMCLSLKIYLGHIQYLESKCHYILVPRIDNYGTYEQTCTNFLGLYDIVSNIFHTPLLTYNVDVSHKKTQLQGFLDLGMSLGKGREQSRIAYFNALQKQEKELKQKRAMEIKKLSNQNIKLLILSHPYNWKDAMIGSPIQKMLHRFDTTFIDGEYLISTDSKKYEKILSENLYWKYNKELIGTIPLLKNKVDGIIFLSSFPCGPDSLVNELLMRKLTLPFLNLIIDEESGSAGMETRLESFIDILEQKRNAC